MPSINVAGSLSSNDTDIYVQFNVIEYDSHFEKIINVSVYPLICHTEEMKHLSEKHCIIYICSTSDIEYI